MRYLAARMKLVDPNMTPGKRSLSVHEGFMQEMYGNGNVISRDFMEARGATHASYWMNRSKSNL